MKNKILTLLLFLFVATLTFGQAVESTQRTLLTKRTASWCPNCGSWGWSFFHDLLADNKEKAVLIAAHYDGILMTNAANEITANFGGLYQPVFFANHTDIAATPFNIATLRTSVKEQVDNNFKTVPIANAGFTPVYDGQKIKVDAKVRFFKAASGDYYLGMYLLEDNVIAYQATIGDNARHMKLLRNSFTSSSWGLPIANGSFAVGQEFNLSFSLNSANPKGKDYEVAGIIWKKNGTRYEVINVWATTNFGTTTAATEFSQVQALTVSPTVAGAKTAIFLTLTESLPQASIQLINISGKTLLKIQKGKLSAGDHHFTIDRPEGITKGVYFIRLTDGKRSMTKRMVFD